MNTLNNEVPVLDTTITAHDAQNLISLLNRAPIKGGEAEIVSLLKHKLSSLIPPPTVDDTEEEPKQDK